MMYLSNQEIHLSKLEGSEFEFSSESDEILYFNTLEEAEKVLDDLKNRTSIFNNFKVIEKI